MNFQAFEQYILSNYQGVIVTDAYAERSFFYNPDGLLPKGIYFATLKNRNGANDKASNLDREGVFRLNIGISKSSYEKLFGTKPARPQKGGTVQTGHDFTKLGELTPHPIYAWLHWVAILNPPDEHLAFVKELLDESYQQAQKKYLQKIKNFKP